MFSTKVLYCTVFIINYPSALVDRGLRLRKECERIEKEEQWVVCVSVRRVFHEDIIQLSSPDFPLIFHGEWVVCVSVRRVFYEDIIQLSPPDFPLIFHGENSQIRFGKICGKLSTVFKIFNNLSFF